MEAPLMVIRSLMAPLLLLIMTTTNALSHESHSGMKYDSFCCNGDRMDGDCQEISDTTVKITSQGYVVTLKPGEHRMIRDTKTRTWTVPYDRARKSTDQKFHACLFPTSDTLRCFYAPPMGF